MLNQRGWTGSALRIRWAADVVRSHRLPDWAPGDLPIDQRQDAVKFLYGHGITGDDVLFYHGTSLEQAKKILNMDLEAQAVGEMSLLDWWEYTMRGPIWGRKDSGLDGGGPLIPDNIQQINWGRSGLAALNTPQAKKRRFLIDRHHASLLENVPL